MTVSVTRSVIRLNSVFRDHANADRAKTVAARSWDDFVSPMWPHVQNYVVNGGQN